MTLKGSKLTSIEISKKTRNELKKYKKDNDTPRASYDQIIGSFLNREKENSQLNKMSKVLMRNPEFIKLMKKIGTENEERINKINKE